MFTDSFSSTVAWMQVQAALAKPGATEIVLALVVLGVVALAADYAHMLYLHYKMVSLVLIVSELSLKQIATRTTALANSWKYMVAARQQTMDLF
jgi:hypothetical protein